MLSFFLNLKIKPVNVYSILQSSLRGALFVMKQSRKRSGLPRSAKNTELAMMAFVTMELTMTIRFQG